MDIKKIEQLIINFLQKKTKTTNFNFVIKDLKIFPHKDEETGEFSEEFYCADVLVQETTHDVEFQSSVSGFNELDIQNNLFLDFSVWYDSYIVKLKKEKEEKNKTKLAKVLAFFEFNKH